MERFRSPAESSKAAFQESLMTRCTIVARNISESARTERLVHGLHVEVAHHSATLSDCQKGPRADALGTTIFHDRPRPIRNGNPCSRIVGANYETGEPILESVRRHVRIGDVHLAGRCWRRSRVSAALEGGQPNDAAMERSRARVVHAQSIPYPAECAVGVGGLEGGRLTMGLTVPARFSSPSDHASHDSPPVDCRALLLFLFDQRGKNLEDGFGLDVLPPLGIVGRVIAKVPETVDESAV